MKTTILGAGFGLYGYLPAMISCGYEVILPERYKEKIDSRKELHKLKSLICWTADEESALTLVDTVVIAKPPHYQEILIPKLLLYKNIRRIFLEKPLAVSPARAKKFFDMLCVGNVDFSINYIFVYECWTALLEKILIEKRNSLERISLIWSFTAHHFKNNLQNWKRFHDLGGGALRFYAIHFLAIAAHLQFDQVNYAKLTEDDSLFQAEFSKADDKLFYVEVDSDNADNSFSIKANDHELIKTVDPFITKFQGDFDCRIDLLKKHILAAKKETRRDFYKRVIDLWDKTERKLTRYSEHE